LEIIGSLRGRLWWYESDAFVRIFGRGWSLRDEMSNRRRRLKRMNFFWKNRRQTEKKIDRLIVVGFVVCVVVMGAGDRILLFEDCSKSSRSFAVERD
jgi:hypothetical protein